VARRASVRLPAERPRYGQVYHGKESGAHPASEAQLRGGFGAARRVKFSWWIPFLALTPAAFVLYWLNTRGATTGQFTDALFVVSLLALIPLAEANGALVERLAQGAPKVFSGLLNACLDNIPEIAIGFWLLLQVVRHPYLLTENYTIVRGLLLGSVIENILFTLGIATLTGALRHGKLRFSREKAAGFASMLGLAVVGLALPTLATSFASEEARTASTEIWVSIVVSGILIISYIAYVAVEVFGVGNKEEAEPVAEETGPATVAHHLAHHAHEEGHASPRAEHELTVEHEEIVTRAAAHQKAVEAERAAPQRNFGVTAGLLVLVVISIAAIAGVCATLVTVTDRVIAHSPLTPLSFGLIVLPIICNFGELIEAGQSAFRKDMEAAMEVAAGSSVQVPLFVTPVLVFTGLVFSLLPQGQPPLTLTFPGLALITLGLAAFVYALVNLDGETTWLEGAQLIVFYAMIAITAFALPGA
jgi:Ca2+:H+ antiporter